MGHLWDRGGGWEKFFNNGLTNGNTSVIIATQITEIEPRPSGGTQGGFRGDESRDTV